MENNFEKEREQIDKIDKEIIDLLEERMEVSKEIGRIKEENDLEVVDPKREKEIIRSRQRWTRLDNRFIEKLYELIFEESRKQQR